MAEASDTFGIIRQNLEDAGCDEHTTQKCIALMKAGRPEETLPLLFHYRRELLDHVRSGQKKLDCLDYLIYQIQKKNL